VDKAAIPEEAGVDSKSKRTSVECANGAMMAMVVIDGIEWQQIEDPTNGTYYFNPKTGESVWEKPGTEARIIIVHMLSS
jgi:hypothetical protein